MFIKGREKKGQKGIVKIVHNLWIKKGVWEIDENNRMNQIRMMNPKDWVKNLEIEAIRREIENEGRDEENDGKIQGNDHTADMHDKNDNINHVCSANEEPIKICL